MARKTSSASAICGTAVGCTNDVTSIHAKPASDSRSTKRILSGVEMDARSFCRPSRGPTSTMRTSGAMQLLYVGCAQRQQLHTAGHLLADLHAQLGDDPGVGRLDHMLHFHRFQHDQWLMLADSLAVDHGDLDHAPRHWRGEAAGAPLRATPTGRGVFHAHGGWAAHSVAAVLPFDDAPIGAVSPASNSLTVDTDAPPRAVLVGVEEAHKQRIRLSVNTHFVGVEVARYARRMRPTRATPGRRHIDPSEPPGGRRTPRILHCGR